jgi:hypothetical protein
VHDAAAKYIPEGKSLQTDAEFIDRIFSFDVIGESEAILAKSVSGQEHKL